MMPKEPTDKPRTVSDSSQSLCPTAGSRPSLGFASHRHSCRRHRRAARRPDRHGLSPSSPAWRPVAASNLVQAGLARHRAVRLIEKQPLHLRRWQPNHVLEHPDRVAEFDLAVAIKICRKGLVGRQRFARTVDVKADDHLQDRDLVLQVHGLAGVSGGVEAGGQVQRAVNDRLASSNRPRKTWPRKTWRRRRAGFSKLVKVLPLSEPSASYGHANEGAAMAPVNPGLSRRQISPVVAAAVRWLER